MFGKLKFDTTFYATVLGVYVLLVLNYLVPDLTANQENYYGLAKQYINPNWIPESFSFSEFVGTRYLFQNLVGYPLQYLSFESVHLIFTNLGLLFLSFPLVRLFQLFGMKSELILLFVGLIFFTAIGSGTYWAGEWIFGGFEAKTFAYVFVLWALVSLFKGKIFAAILLTIPATYFHFLVGGYAFFFISSYSFFFEQHKKDSIKGAAAYIAFVTPFILFLYFYGFRPLPDIYAHGKTADWIYTHFRNPHHTAIFADKWLFERKIFPGIIKATGVYVLIVGLYFWKFNQVERLHKKLLIFTLYSMTILFGLLFVAWLDHQGIVSKLYLFRFGAVAKLVSLLSLILFIPQRFYQRISPHLMLSLVSICFILGGARFYRNFLQGFTKMGNSRGDQLANRAKIISHKGDIFLLLNHTSMKEDDVKFIRLSERDLFVSFKFIPAEKKEILEWYQRILDVEVVLKQPELINTFLKKYPQISYIISIVELPLKQIGVVEGYKIYKRDEI